MTFHLWSKIVPPISKVIKNVPKILCLWYLVNLSRIKFKILFLWTTANFVFLSKSKALKAYGQSLFLLCLKFEQISVRFIHFFSFPPDPPTSLDRSQFFVGCLQNYISITGFINLAKKTLSHCKHFKEWFLSEALFFVTP